MRQAVMPLYIAALVLGQVVQPKPHEPQTVKVAAVQCSSIMGDVEENRKKLIGLVEEAANKGARIVVLPEASITGYLSQDAKINWHLEGWPIEPVYSGLSPLNYAEQVPGDSTRIFGAIAKRLKIYVTVPFVEIEPQKVGVDPKFFNAVCLVGPSGEVVANYRKLNPWPSPEKSWATTGDRGVQVYDTEYGRVGLAICYDIHTILDELKPKRIWALLYPIAWVSDSHPADWFWHILPTQLKAYHHYVIGANWSVDAPQPWFGYGFSTIYAPGGDILNTAHSLYGSSIIYADLKTETLTSDKKL